MNPSWVVLTGRLVMRPVAATDLAELTRLKGDPQVFAVLLGGVRSAQRVGEELAEDVAFWGERGVGIWSVRDRASDRFLGITGFMLRPDAVGVALRFAFFPNAHGRGYAREAASAALRFAHERAGLERVVAVAREDNFASRQVLGGIGMRPCGEFDRAGVRMLIYESVRRD